MKSFFSCVDTGYVKYAPQPLQHLANADKAKKCGGKITFYTGEDFETLESQNVIKTKIEEENLNINGIIFFTLKQFFYGRKLNFIFLRSILEKGYEVHFSRENISILNIEELYKIFPILYATKYVTNRDASREYWKSVWNYENL